MNEYSFIVEFDEMSENQINKLWEYLSERNIKFHVLKDEDLKNENQQKEFIEYLEDEINMCDGFLDTIKSDLEELPYAGRVAGKTYITTKIMKNETSKKIFEEVLSKYKKIIGGDNNE